MPGLASIAEEFSDRVGFMTLLIDFDDYRDRAITITEDANAPFITINADNEDLYPFVAMFQHRYIPQIVIIDGDGNVITNIVPDSSDDYRAAIEDALSGLE